MRKINMYMKQRGDDYTWMLRNVPERGDCEFTFLCKRKVFPSGAKKVVRVEVFLQIGDNEPVKVHTEVGGGCLAPAKAWAWWWAVDAGFGLKNPEPGTHLCRYVDAIRVKRAKEEKRSKARVARAERAQASLAACRHDRPPAVYESNPALYGSNPALYGSNPGKQQAPVFGQPAPAAKVVTWESVSRELLEELGKVPGSDAVATPESVSEALNAFVSRALTLGKG